MRHAVEGFAGRIELVGESLVFADDPGRYRSRLDAQGRAGIDAVRGAGAAAETD